MVLIGFSLAYWLSANTMALATQIIMIGGLLFSPITYPVDRIPNWLASIYDFLPFVPTSNLIRATLFHLGDFSYFNFIYFADLDSSSVHVVFIGVVKKEVSVIWVQPTINNIIKSINDRPILRIDI